MNPFIAFAAIWAVITALDSAALLYFYQPVTFPFLAMLVGGFVVSVVLAKHLPLASRERSFLPGLSGELATSISRFRDLCMLLGAVIFAIEIVTSGGVPIYWMLTGQAKGYADFGMTSVHGLFNALLLFSMTASSVLAICTRDRVKNIALLLLCLLVIFVLFNRGLLFIFGIQFVGIVLLRIKNPMDWKYIASFGVVLIVAFLAFGVIGNARVGCAVAVVAEPVHPKDSLVAVDADEQPPYIADVYKLFPEGVSDAEIQASFDGMWTVAPIGCNPYLGMVPMSLRGIFSWVPTEFLWGYAYATTGLNNLMYNLDRVEPGYVPVYTFAKIVPTAFYNAFGLDRAVDDFELAHPAFTVSTAFSGVVADFGLWGMLALIPVLLFSYYAYRSAKSGNLVAIMVYATMFQSIVLSPYVDTILYGPFLMQIILIVASGYFSKLRRRQSPKPHSESLS